MISISRRLGTGSDLNARTALRERITASRILTAASAFLLARISNLKLDRGGQLPPDGIEARPRHGNANPHLENFLRTGGTGKNPGNCAGSYSLSIVLRNIAFPPASQPIARRRKSGCRGTKRTFWDAGDGATRTTPQLCYHIAVYALCYVS
jgi:hypothetical protein